MSDGCRIIISLAGWRLTDWLTLLRGWDLLAGSPDDVDYSASVTRCGGVGITMSSYTVESWRPASAERQNVVD